MKYRRNSDEEIRNLQRQWEATHSPEDLERLNIARVRASLPPYHALKPAWSGVVNAPPEAIAAWGARAILANGRIDLVGDRTETVGAHEAQEELRGLVNAGPLRSAIAEARRLIRRHEITRDEAKEVILFDSDRLRILGNTNASGGYLYLIAYLRPAGWSEPLIQKSCEKCDTPGTDEQLGECSVCSVLLCHDCRETCEHCDQYVCEGFHDTNCHRCEGPICGSDECQRNRKPRYCEKCGEPYCYDCRSYAKDCACEEEASEEYCSNCDDELADCDECGETFCSCNPCPCRQGEDEGEESEFRRFNPDDDDDFYFDGHNAEWFSR